MFRNRFVSVGANIAYGNTSRLRSLNIDIVHTGRTDGNQLKLRIIRNDIGRNDNLIGDDDVRTAYAYRRFRSICRAVNRKLVWKIEVKSPTG